MTRWQMIRGALNVLLYAVMGYKPELNHNPQMLAVNVPPCRGCKWCKQ
jgi:hypothetical protein